MTLAERACEVDARALATQNRGTMHDDHELMAPAAEEPAPPSAPLEPSFLPELVLWAILGLVCAGLFSLTLIAPEPEMSGEAGPTAGGVELRFQARYAVGVQTLLGRLGEGFADNASSKLLDQVRKMASTTDERLCLVPVLAHLSGPEEALEQVAALLERTDLQEVTVRDLHLLERIYGEATAELSEEERAGFQERRGWYAQLALAYGKPAEDPERRQLLFGAMKVAVVMLAVVAGVIAAGCVGLALFVITAVMASQGRLRTFYRPRDERGSLPEPGAVGSFRRLPFLETVLVFILATVGASLLSGLVITGTKSQTVGLLATLLAVPAVLWPYYRAVDPAEVRRAYGWHRGQGVWREIGWGLVGYVAGAPLLIAGILMSLALSPFMESPPHHPLMDSLAGAGPATILAILVVACVSAPLVEETVFRGGFYHYLRGRLGVVASALPVSLVFAFIHPQGVLGVPPLVALAMILALIREWRGSLVACVAVHAVHNGLATSVLLLMLG